MDLIYQVPEKVKGLQTKKDVEALEIPTLLTGTITLRLPSYEESTSIALEFGGEAEAKEGEQKLMKAKDLISRMMEICEKHVKKVDISGRGGKMKIESLKELGCLREGRALINDIFDSLVHGFKLGNG